MFRVLTATLIALTLTGCMNSITQLAEPVDRSFYTVDLKNYSYCLGNSSTCHNLSTIVNGTQFAEPIEEVYGRKISGPNYRSSLLRMMLDPDTTPYDVEKTSDNGRFYRLPANTHTDTVWRSMEDIRDSFYNDKMFKD